MTRGKGKRKVSSKVLAKREQLILLMRKLLRFSSWLRTARLLEPNEALDIILLYAETLPKAVEESVVAFEIRKVIHFLRLRKLTSLLLLPSLPFLLPITLLLAECPLSVQIIEAVEVEALLCPQPLQLNFQIYL